MDKDTVTKQWRATIKMEDSWKHRDATATVTNVTAVLTLLFGSGGVTERKEKFAEVCSEWKAGHHIVCLVCVTEHKATQSRDPELSDESQVG